jgi:hypothetical protein
LSAAHALDRHLRLAIAEFSTLSPHDLHQQKESAMSVIDKMIEIVQRREQLSLWLEVRAQALLDRYNEIEPAAARAFDKHAARLDAEQESATKLEHAIDVLSNAPPDAPPASLPQDSK